MEPDVSEDLPNTSTEPAAPVLPRFCGACGSPWQPEWTTCPRCEAARATAPLPVARPAFVPSVRSSIGLYFAILALSAVEILIVGVTRISPPTAEWAFTLAFVMIVLIASIPAWRMLLAQIRRPFRPVWALSAPLMAVGTFALGTALVRLLTMLMDLPKVEYLRPFEQHGYGLPSAILLIAVAPAIFEEIAFRGVLFSSLDYVLQPRETIIVTGLLFAILHLSIPTLPFLLVMGLALGWLRHRTGSLVPGMILHFTHNLLCVLLERGF
jgi:membrane protease YdiL (CAAX protease family)